MSSLTGVNKSLVIFAALVIVLAGIKAASVIVIPFVLAAFIAIICNPLIRFFAGYKIPKGVAVVLVMLIIVGVGISLAGLVGQSMTDFSEKLPEYKTQLKEEFVWVVNVAASYNILIDKEQIISLFDPGKMIDVATNMLTGLGGVMANLFLIILTVVFMLFEGPMLNKKIHLALDDPEMKMQQIDRFLGSINSYLAIKTMVSLATGLLAGFMLWALDVDYFVLWGVVAFMLNYIPNIGSIIAAVPPVLLALITQGPLVAGIIAGGYLVINTVMGNIVEPKFMGKGLGLSTLVVFLSLIFWGWLMGTVGMLLSVPLTMIVKIALETSQEGRWLATLLGNGEELTIDQ
ncbi:AI-2E family transporter [Pseudoalteromonas sp. SSMSWG5]|uniref:AI-2E family transporter n=1 Tax=Pseudoalteromonas TaxID=53246 RepID=UPI000C408DC1|nr:MULTISPECIES: AI-2E family transporter [unclassified Pseudoalteromonas]MBU76149.1 pheromone autoinducer 2 transporter [Pseudoalteromonadaceae bacterium]HCV05494.1 pheromone autoinducer 2 transporter [Pseudoalteromonas sp.]MCF2902434.1 AI-2E family transporter [Pseudoalteromonas sp. OFAV1]MCF2920272.1 AI-2E family transporter [Pseudoalteromonas sp. APAL1]MCO7251290.1 AI-2E family transporter [Pseudoalteromonas sp. Ps84H-4]